MKLDDTLESYIMLWKRLRATRVFFYVKHKRYCVRNIMRLWFGAQADDRLLFAICSDSAIGGYEELPDPMKAPHLFASILLTTTSMRTGISIRKLSLDNVYDAYNIVFKPKKKVKKICV